MIEIKEKEKCCGCEACVQICPKRCISLDEDDEGFRYPNVDCSECINCGLCEKVCPVLNPGTQRNSLFVFASKNSNDHIRCQSSSGGVFTMLAELILDSAGVVFGARWNENWEVVHGYIENKSDISVFRGSKYVQSHIGTAYADVERFLKSGRMVLFSGTPCQIAGLRLYLRKEYDNLLTVDFICHGVPSPGVFRWYMQEELNLYAHRVLNNTSSTLPILSIPKGNVVIPNGIEINDIRFRDKSKGWKKYSFALDLTEVSADGEKKNVSLSYTLHNNPFLKGFLADLYLRPSCYSCPAKKMRSGSDITIADCWEIDALYKGINDDMGVSKIHVNTLRGKEAIIRLQLERYDVPLSIAMKNLMIVNSAVKPRKRTEFFNNKIKGFRERVNEFTRKPLHIAFLSKARDLMPSFIVDKIRVMKYKLKSVL